MTVSAPVVLVSGVSNTTKAVQSTASFTPTAFAVVVAVCAVREATAGAPAPDIVVTNSHAGAWSWEELTISDAAGNRHTLSAFIAAAPAGPGAGTVTFQPTENVNRLEWLVFEVTGASADTNNNATPAVSTSATPSLTLPGSPVSTSIVIGLIAAVADTDGVDPGAGYTEFHQSSGTSTTLQAQYVLSPSSTTVDWSGCPTTSNLLVAFELEAEPTDLLPSALSIRRRLRRSRH